MKAIVGGGIFNLLAGGVNVSGDYFNNPRNVVSIKAGAAAFGEGYDFTLDSSGNVTSSTILHSDHSKINFYFDPATGNYATYSYSSTGQLTGIQTSYDAQLNNPLNFQEMLDFDKQIYNLNNNNLFSNTLYNQISNYLSDWMLTEVPPSPSISNYDFGLSFSPIGAFYDSQNPVNDNAASIAAKTPVLLDAAYHGLNPAALNSRDANLDGLLSGAELNTLFAWADVNENGVADSGEITALSALGLNQIRTGDYGFYTAGNSRLAPAPAPAIQPAKRSDTPAAISPPAQPAYIAPAPASGLPGKTDQTQAVPFSNYRTLRDTDNIFISGYNGGTIITWTANQVKINFNNQSYLIGTDGNDYFDATSYAAYPQYFNSNLLSNFLGGYGSDTVGGSNRNDNLWGGYGNDLLLGYAGDDKLYGEEDNDELGGQDGNDYLDGGIGADRLFGGNGYDTLNGGEGNDHLSGENDNDSLYGGGGADTLYGGLGNDYLDGGDDNDGLVGDAGNDTLFGGLGLDELHGGDGNDQLAGESGDDKVFGETGDDTLWGGDGNDSLWGFTASNDPKQSLNPGETDNDRIYGEAGADILNGGLGNDYLDGGSENDFLQGGDGNDTLFGGIGADTLYGGQGDDYLDGGNDNDALVGDTGNDTLFGGLGLDELQGGDGNDKLLGEAGDDILFGQTGDDTLWGGDGNDQLRGFTASNEAKQSLNAGETDNDVIFGEAGNDILNGGLGNDYLSGGTENDNLFGGDGNDQLLGDAGDDRLFGETGDDSLWGGDGNDILLGFTASDDAKQSLNPGETDNDSLYGGLGDDNLFGGLGNDYLDGGDGNDVALGDQGNDTVFGGAGNDELQGNDGNDQLLGEAGDDRLFGQTGDDALWGGDGNDVLLGFTAINESKQSLNAGETDSDSLYGGNGNDILLGGLGNDILNGDAGVDELQGGDDNDLLYGGAGDDHLFGQTGDDALYGGDGNDVLLGFTAINETKQSLSWHYLPNQGYWTNETDNDSLYGGAGNDYLLGGLGNDYLDGGAGADDMEGGVGDDTYIVNSVNDSILENANAGYDSVISSSNYLLNANIEELRLLAGLDINGTGNALDNRIIGNERNNILDGVTGWDTLIGGAGNDIYYVDNAGDQVVELAGEGTDRVQSSTGYTLGDNVENLILLDFSKPEQGLVDGEATLVYGYPKRYELDYMQGDAVTNFQGTCALTAIANLLTQTNRPTSEAQVIQVAINNNWAVIDPNRPPYEQGGSNYIQQQAILNNYYGIRNDLLPGYNEQGIANLIMSGRGVIIAVNAGQLWGEPAYAGDGSVNHAVTVTGAVYSDVDGRLMGFYIADSGRHKVSDMTRYVSIEQFRLAANVYSAYAIYTLEPLKLWNENIDGDGNGLDNSLIGNRGDNLLNGGLGNDSLEGAAGNDTLDGGAGNDSLTGGDGNDTYIVDLITTLSGTTAIAALEDTVTETGGTAGGNDTLQLRGGSTNTVATTLTLAADLENLDASGTGASLLNLTGNVADNILTGNAANNSLDGGAGVDTLLGGSGNDTYTVDNSGDIVTENLNEGIDLINSSVSYTLSANVENLTLTGTTAINAGGNSLNNLLTGNSGNNSLDGGAGVDTLVGGAGNDTYIVDLITTGTGPTAAAALEDTITETGGTAGGIDTLQLRGGSTNTAATTLTLAADLENLDASATGASLLNLTGNAAANILTGNAAANSLNGGAGVDTMVGGLGNDTYTVDNAGDVVTENAGEGTDLVNSSVSYTLAANVENLTMTGTAAINATANALANLLTGNSAANTLNGGDGNDTYVVDLVTIGNAAILHDTVVETGGTAGGIDTLQLSGSSTNTVATTLTLATDLENFNAQYTGNSLLNLTGNASANILTGNTAANVLTGGNGNDTYVVDLITVNNGSALVAQLHDSVIETGGTVGGIDTLQLSGSSTNTIATTLVLAADLENLNAQYTGSSLLNLTGNAAANALTGNAAANVLIGGDGNDSLNGGAGVDSMVGGLGNDTYTVDNAGDVVTENLNEGTDLVNSSVTYTLAANVENLTLTGTATIDGTGNDYANVLIGNNAANTLGGGLGNDIYVVDLITVGSGDAAIAALHDSVIETGGTAGGIDTLQLSGSSTNTVATTLTLDANLENLNAQYTGNSLLNLTGNASANTLSGNSAANILIGGDGNDTYVVDLVTVNSSGTLVAQLHDTVVETGGTVGGIDTLQLSGTTSNTVATTLTLDANLENLNAGNTGTSLLNLTGNASANTLSGNSAANILIGGTGNDTYVVDLITVGSGASAIAALHDTVVETGGTTGGIDTLQLSGSSTNTVATTLTLDANLENLNAGNTGTSLLNLTGNVAANVLTGNAADNTLAGGAGNDSLNGGAGNDKLYGYDVLDSTGATLVNQLTISAKADLLADAVAAKMDVYIDGILKTSFNVANTSAYQTYTVDPALLGIGGRRVQVAFSNDVYLPGPPVQDRNLRVSGISVNGVFTAATAGGVYLDTGTGAAALDGVGLAAGTNILSNNGALSFSLDGNDSLDGGLGTDTLGGGLGDDVYVVDNSGDVVIENANAGIDTIKSSFTYNLNTIANIENITLTGTAAINATGDAGVNLLNGNAADNSLDGGAGIDSLVGGAGNDTYIVDLVTNGNVAALQDSIYESSTTTNGIDTLQLRGGSTNTVATTLGLSTNLENLDASNTGNSQLNLTGNASDNRLTGNAANNVLNGGTGNDSLIGGAGNDTLIGGAGNDTYQFGLGSGAEVIQENDATIGNNDIVAVIGGIDINQLWFRQLGNDLEMSVIGTGDKTTFSNWYSGSAYHVEQITDGGKTLADTKIDALVQAMAAFAPPAAGQTTLPTNYQTALAPVIAANWQ